MFVIGGIIVATDFQFRAEQKRRLYMLRKIALNPELLEEFIRQTVIEMAEEDVAVVDKQIFLETDKK